ncbi:MAG: hypothetical protein V3U74_06040 [Thermodesulfobacteriota bacterium]
MVTAGFKWPPEVLIVTDTITATAADTVMMLIPLLGIGLRSILRRREED